MFAGQDAIQSEHSEEVLADSNDRPQEQGKIAVGSEMDFDADD